MGKKYEYDLVVWYINNIGFDNYKGETRDDVLDLSTKEFFEKMKEEGTGGDKFKIADWRSKIAGEISDDADNWFDKKIQAKINSSNLNSNYKGDLLSDVSSYDSVDEVDNDIEGIQELQVYEEQVEEAKDTIKNSRSYDEIREAKEDLRELNSKVYGGVMSGVSKNAGREKADVLSSIDSLINQAQDREEDLNVNE